MTAVHLSHLAEHKERMPTKGNIPYRTVRLCGLGLALKVVL